MLENGNFGFPYSFFDPAISTPSFFMHPQFPLPLFQSPRKMSGWRACVATQMAVESYVGATPVLPLTPVTLYPQVRHDYDINFYD